jgi:phage terminase Nu1 subunit (DNA packaging protein)
MAEPPPTLNKLLVKKAEIARLTSLSERTIENLMAKGLPHLRLSYRCVLFDPVSVANFLKQRFSAVRRSPIGRFGR